MEPDLIIVGAGITGLTAAIEAAERGRRVVVAEAHSRPGGRARSLAAPFRANTGPHAIYADGPWWAWLERRGLTPPIAETPRDASLVRVGGHFGPWPAELSRAIAALPADAPSQESFRSWLLRHVSASEAEAIIGLTFIPTFDYDPGRLSAAFARERIRRALSGGARYVAGGWSTLAGLLAERATSLGVQIHARTRITALPEGQTILATSLAAARQLTGDRSLTWPSVRVATFDLGLRASASPGWFRVMDLDDRIYGARYSLADPTLAPPGHELIQIAAACCPHERKTDAERRVQRLLDQVWPGWRAAVRWRRGSVLTHCTGAIDLPGTTWRDRPVISRSNTLAVATDQSAAPGLLAETAITAAQLAVRHLGETALIPSARTRAPSAGASTPAGCLAAGARPAADGTGG